MESIVFLLKIIFEKVDQEEKKRNLERDKWNFELDLKIKDSLCHDGQSLARWAQHTHNTQPLTHTTLARTHTEQTERVVKERWVVVVGRNSSG